MFEINGPTRRDFMKSAGTAGALIAMGQIGRLEARSGGGRAKSTVYSVQSCPIHDNETRHRGVDALFRLLADNGSFLFETTRPHPWGGPGGMIAAHDVILIKVNCQWKCRGTTNTDVVRGLVHRILQHPDGFTGEIVIIENGQGQGAFNGLPLAWGSYNAWPNIRNNVWINAEEENTLTVDHLVNTVFAGRPVSSTLLDPMRSRFISASDHTSDGYRKVSDVSYPCFTTRAGHRVELKEGIWNGTGHDDNIKLINIPVFKHHDGTGITGALKHTYGILTMSDGYSGIRHYSQSGTQCGRMFMETRAPVLNIVDCIWVSQDSLSGYPVSTTTRNDMLLAGIDPVALDYHAAKHVLLPRGGSYASQHDPDSFSGLINHLDGAQTVINAGGGIGGQMANRGDANINVLSTVADAVPSPDLKVNGGDGPITVPRTTPVSVKLALLAGGQAGKRADQWVVARTPSGWWSFSKGTWAPGFRLFSSGPLGDLPSKEILNATLPPGEYTLYAAVDDNANGLLNATWWDSVRITVTP